METQKVVELSNIEKRLLNTIFNTFPTINPQIFHNVIQCFGKEGVQAMKEKDIIDTISKFLSNNVPSLILDPKQILTFTYEGYISHIYSLSVINTHIDKDFYNKNLKLIKPGIRGMVVYKDSYQGYDYRAPFIVFSAKGANPVLSVMVWKPINVVLEGITYKTLEDVPHISKTAYVDKKHEYTSSKFVWDCSPEIFKHTKKGWVDGNNTKVELMWNDIKYSKYNDRKPR